MHRRWVGEQGLNNTSTGGPWAPHKRSHHINYLELLAAFLALKTFAANTQLGNSSEIRQCDSHCLPQQNGGDPFRDTLQSGSAHLEMVLGEEYIHPCRTPPQEAECQSRLALATHTGLQRWAATPSDLPTTSRQAIGPFSIDLFVSHTNAQLSTYCSWKLEPSAIAIDALSIS